MSRDSAYRSFSTRTSENDIHTISSTHAIKKIRVFIFPCLSFAIPKAAQVQCHAITHAYRLSRQFQQRRTTCGHRWTALADTGDRIIGLYGSKVVRQSVRQTPRTSHRRHRADTADDIGIILLDTNDIAFTLADTGECQHSCRLNHAANG